MAQKRAQPTRISLREQDVSFLQRVSEGTGPTKPTRSEAPVAARLLHAGLLAYADGYSSSVMITLLNVAAFESKILPCYKGLDSGEHVSLGLKIGGRQYALKLEKEKAKPIILPEL